MLSLTWGVALTLCVVTTAASQEPFEVRVGLLAYKDFAEDLKSYERLFTDLAKASPEPVHFQLASGTYGDLFYWLDRGKIDLAVVTPGIIAEGFDWEIRALEACRFEYVATSLLPPASSPLATDERQRPGRHEQYRSLCLARHGSSLLTIEDVRRVAARGEARYLFVDPLSISGRIAPMYALRGEGVDPKSTHIRYTASHSNSLRAILEDEPGVEKLAFVWDGIEMDERLASECQRVDFPALTALAIPADVVIARKDFAHAKALQSLLINVRPYEFCVVGDWPQRYGVVRRWMADLGLPSVSAAAQQVSLQQIGAILLHDAQSQPRPPRIALVLSSGGAKCAFQVGAVAALEEELARLRTQAAGATIDIGLVVGTSGGAINSLPVALGITQSRAGYEDMQTLWRSLDQREIIRPSLLVRANISLWFALVEVAIVVACVRRFYAPDTTRARTLASGILLGLGLIQLVLSHLPWKPWGMLGGNHVAHHAWLWGTFGMRGAGWMLLVLGSAGLLLRRLPNAWGQRVSSLLKWSRPIVWCGLLGLPLIQIATVFFHEETLSDSEGIERIYCDQIPRLIDAQLKRDELPPLDLPETTRRGDRLAAISRQIVERGLLKRDLVLTGSCLAQPSADLPLDLYFFAATERSPPPTKFGSHGIDLAEHAGNLLDAVMGSGTIYPLFPPREIRDFPRLGQSIQLVDGAFAHYSPIEAAVLWGASHIILIDASPGERTTNSNFLANALGAFSHLYAQAQRMDAQSKEHVMIFTLAPQAPHICLLDFADNLIADAIAKGYREARAALGSDGGAQSGFRKELGEPRFWEPR